MRLNPSSIYSGFSFAFDEQSFSDGGVNFWANGYEGGGEIVFENAEGEFTIGQYDPPSPCLTQVIATSSSRQLTRD